MAGGRPTSTRQLKAWASRDYLERVTRRPDVGVAEKAFDRVMRGMVVPLYLARICRG